MNTKEPTTNPIDLHAVEGLRVVEVSKTIKLRHLVAEDADRIFAILEADPAIRDRVTVAAQIRCAEDVAEEVASSRANPGMIRYTILLEDRPVGLISLWRDNGYFGETADPDRYGFGYFLDPNERGKGIVADALGKLMEAAKKHLVVSEFLAFCEDDNAASARVLEKLGFTMTDQTFTEPTQGWTERKYVKSL